MHDVLGFLNTSLQDEKKGADTAEGHDEWLHGKTLIRPLDQVELTEAVRMDGVLISILQISTSGLVKQPMLFIILTCVFVCLCACARARV